MSRRLDPALDALASRKGAILALAFLLTISVTGVLTVEAAVNSVERDRHIFEARHARNGFVSLSDIQRLSTIMGRALNAGEMTPDLRADFNQAADILYVRVLDFRRSLAPELRYPSAEDAIANIEELIQVSDAALADGITDLPTLAEDIFDVSERIRVDLATWSDDVALKQGDLLSEKLRTLDAQRRNVWVSEAGMTMLGIGAIFLLRREVVARKRRESAEKRVNFLAYYDALTELPNRPQFQERIGAMLGKRDDMALFFVDLDQFKGVNDTYGHAFGDAALCHVANVIDLAAKRCGGFAARLGGDEFAIVIPTDNLETARDLGEKILDEIYRPFSFEQEKLQVSVSIGIARASSDQPYPDIDKLSRYADFALYVSKDEGRNRATIYDEPLHQRYVERRTLLNELPDAVRSGKLELYLQPKVTLPGTEIYGFEALVRWYRDGRVIPPNEFINLAEETGLITELDVFLLTRAARTLSEWNLAHGTRLSVSVNLSALHFNSPRIIGQVERVLQETGLAPDCLTLEITETVELRDWKQVERVLGGLRALGCRISIDDFGSGFSSMAYLRAIKADELKIDRTLVEEIEVSDSARFVFDAVLDLATSLGMDVVVEGVETDAQSVVVQSLGARCAQGFLFGRPLPATEALSTFYRRMTATSRDAQKA